MTLREKILSQDLICLYQKGELSLKKFLASNGEYKFEVHDGSKNVIGFCIHETRKPLSLTLVCQKLLSQTLFNYDIVFFDHELNSQYVFRSSIRNFRQYLHVYDNNDQLIGYVQQRFRFIGYRIDMFDPDGILISSLKAINDSTDPTFQYEKLKIGEIRMRQKNVLSTWKTDFELRFEHHNLCFQTKLLMISATILFNLIQDSEVPI